MSRSHSLVLGAGGGVEVFCGVVWPAIPTTREGKRRTLSGGRYEPITVTNTYGIITVNRGKMGDTYITQTINLTDQEVLSYLVELLRSPAMPWAHPELAKVRPAIEQAVQDGDVRRPGVAKAVRRLLGIAGNVALGVIGNYATDGLQHFFG